MIYKVFALIFDSVFGIMYKKGDIMPKNYLLIYSERLATETELLCQKIKAS